MSSKEKHLVTVSRILKSITKRINIKGLDDHDLTSILGDMRITFKSDFVCIALLKNSDDLINPEFISGALELSQFPVITVDQPSACKRALYDQKVQIRNSKNEDNEDYWVDYVGFKVKSEMVVPIIFESTSIGVILLASTKEVNYQLFSDDLKDISDFFAIAIYQHYFLSTATRISNLSFGHTENDMVFTELVDTCSEVANSPLSVLRLLVEENGVKKLELKAVNGIDDSRIAKYVVETDDNFCWNTITNADTLLASMNNKNVKDTELVDFVIQIDRLSDKNFEPFGKVIKSLSLNSVASIPLISDNKVIGILNTYSKRNSAFLDKQLYYLMILAGNAADAILRNVLIKSNKEILERTVTKADELLSMTRKTAFFLMTKSSNHEIKNTLYNIANELDQLNDSGSKKRSNKNQKLVESSELRIQRLAERVEKLLELFENENREAKFIDINTILKDLGSFFHSPNAEVPTYVTYELSDEKPTFYCEESELIIVIYNILSNASRAIEKGKTGFIIVTSEVLEDNVQIRISDNGKGIRKEHDDLIYESYFSTTVHGTGLGLYHVKELVEQVLGGSIGHKSELNKGTEFIVSLPQY